MENNKKKNTGWTHDTTISLVATFVAILALLFTIFEFRENRIQARLSVRPRLAFAFETFDGWIGFRLHSTGLGPAIIKNITVSVNGNVQKSWTSTAQALGVDYKKIADISPVAGLSVRPDTILNLFAVQGDTEDAHILHNHINNVAMRICYCSYYDECWVVLNNSIEQQESKCDFQAWNAFTEPLSNSSTKTK